MSQSFQFPRWPSPSSSAASFAVAASGFADGILVSVADSLLMAVVEGIDVYVLTPGGQSTQFSIDVWEGGGTVNMGTIFGNEVSPSTSLNFSWRGLWPVYSNQQIKLHAINGQFSASWFGFLTGADNVPH